MNYKQLLGRWGEKCAMEFVQEQGLTILETNARTPYGELDIVAMESDQIVFIEVKTRSSDKLGKPEDAVQSRKIEHLLHAAEAYMQEHENLSDNWRIDVIAIVGGMNVRKNEIEWFKNAVE